MDQEETHNNVCSRIGTQGIASSEHELKEFEERKYSYLKRIPVICGFEWNARLHHPQTDYYVARMTGFPNGLRLLCLV